MDPLIHPTWQEWLSPVLDGASFQDMCTRIREREAQGVAVFPPPDVRLRVFRSDPLAARAIILGQDPYHGPGQAMGLAFSVPSDQPVPRSLSNIFKEIEADGGRSARGRSGDLSAWEDQGVLLMNTILTVEQGRPLSHRGWGWETLTSLALQRLSHEHSGLAFLLWGQPAQAAASVVDFSRHLRLATSHPSPLAVRRGFQGCRHFSKTNAWLESRSIAPIDW